MDTAVEREDALHYLEKDPAVAEVPLASLGARPGPGHPVFVRQHFPVPDIDARAHRLAIGGAVARELSLDLAEIGTLPFMRRTAALECAGNARAWVRPRVPRVQWGLGGASVIEVGGTPLAPLLERAGPMPGASEAVFTGADSGTVDGRTVAYERSLPLELARDPGVLLVSEMNGEPLRPEHGAPLRLFVPGWYAMATVKWLTRITLVEAPFSGYYQAEDYVYQNADGARVPVMRMRPRAVITAPADGVTLSAGPVLIEGIAWSGMGRIERVLVSVDGGASWEPASLAESDVDAPRAWRFDWTSARPGVHEIVARAHDAAGHEQPLEPVWNALGYGNNAVQRIRVKVGAGAPPRRGPR